MWCKRSIKAVKGQQKSEDVFSVGADGRGGDVKVLFCFVKTLFVDAATVSVWSLLLGKTSHLVWNLSSTAGNHFITKTITIIEVFPC